MVDRQWWDTRLHQRTMRILSHLIAAVTRYGRLKLLHQVRAVAKARCQDDPHRLIIQSKRNRGSSMIFCMHVCDRFWACQLNLDQMLVLPINGYNTNYSPASSRITKRRVNPWQSKTGRDLTANEGMATTWENQHETRNNPHTRVAESECHKREDMEVTGEIQVPMYHSLLDVSRRLAFLQELAHCPCYPQVR